MSRKFIYVCLSECKQEVKVGITNSLNTRVTSLKTEDGKSFDTVFCSKKVETTFAKEVEQKVTEKFKANLLRGKEWYNIKPLLIIEYLLNEIGLEPYEFGEIETEFPAWEISFQEYRAYKETVETRYIKEKQSKGLYSIMYLDKDELKCIGFCNYGDAKNFYYKNKEFIKMAYHIVESLYGASLQTLYTLQIPTRKNIYNLRESITKKATELENILKIIKI